MHKKKLVFIFLFVFGYGFAQKSEIKNGILNIIEGKNATVAVSLLGIDFPLKINNTNAQKKLPMQSVFKFHIALAVLDLVDQKKLDLNQKIFINKSDLLPNTWSPIREKFPDGNVELSLSEIIDYTVAQSDNVGCDVLLKLIGGPKIVNNFLISKGVKDTQIVYNEEVMQSSWNNQYQNYTTSFSASKLLKDFYDGKIISKTSTDFLYNVMLRTSTGTNKIVEPLPKSTPVAHKTGSSGKNKDGLIGAENDMGIITLPNGKHYALSIFVSNSTETYEATCKIISNISKVVWEELNKK